MYFVFISPNFRYCVFVGTKDRFTHTHSRDEILARYGDKIKMCQRMPHLYK